MTTNGTYAFGYTLLHDSGNLEVNDIVVIPINATEIGQDSELSVEKRDSRCYNNVNKAKGAGCPVNKGLGFAQLQEQRW